MKKSTLVMVLCGVSFFGIWSGYIHSGLTGRIDNQNHTIRVQQDRAQQVEEELASFKERNIALLADLNDARGLLDNCQANKPEPCFRLGFTEKQVMAALGAPTELYTNARRNVRVMRYTDGVIELTRGRVDAYDDMGDYLCGAGE